MAPIVLENLECDGTEARLVDCPRISAETAAEYEYSPYNIDGNTNNRCDPLLPNYAFVACGTTSGPRALPTLGCVHVVFLCGCVPMALYSVPATHASNKRWSPRRCREMVASYLWNMVVKRMRSATTWPPTT